MQERLFDLLVRAIFFIGDFLMQRTKYGRFAKGNKGGPGRPKKRREQSAECRVMRAMHLEPPKEAENLVWVDWVLHRRWAAVVCDDGVLEVRNNELLREVFLRFRVELRDDGVKECVVIGERIAADPYGLTEKNDAQSDDAA